MMRQLLKSDLAQIRLIENEVQVTPWTEETFKMCFEAGYRGWIIEVDQKMIGFVMLSLRADEGHILNLGVRRAYQRQGFGMRLLRHVMDYAKEYGADMIYLEVRRTNVKAIALYQKLQFQQIGERKHYYPWANGAEDALVFARGLSNDQG